MDLQPLRDLLRREDDPAAVERPRDQDLDQAVARARSLADDLRGRFADVTVEIGPPEIQDASHLAHFAVAPGATSRGHGIWVRISNFGDLASTGAVLPGAYGDGDIAELIDPSEWSDVLQLLDRHGYRYVPQDLLFEDYDGRNEVLVAFYQRNGSRLSWWTRFFDYI